MFTRMLRNSVLACFAIVALPKIALPQAFDLNKSTGAPGTIYHGSAIDDVNLSSGNLRISIPLLDLPGRGLNTSIYLTYNSKVWNTQVHDDPFGYTYAVADFDADTLQRPTYGWGLGVPRMYQKEGNFWTYCVLTSGSGCGAAYFYYTHVMADGVRYSVVNEGFPISSSNPTPPGYWSFDGSYLRSNSTGIHYKDGVVTRVAGSAGQPDVTLKDTNGNYIRCIPTSCTDTLGRVINFNYSGTLIQSMTYLDSSGATQSVTFTYETKTFYYPWVTDFFHPSCWDFPCGFSRRLTASVLRRVTLPNNLSYEFEYFVNTDGTTTGEITKITLPTGGYIRYTYDWATAYRIDGQSGPEFAQQRAVKTRTVSSDGTPASEKTWTYVVQNADCSTQLPNVTSTVTDPLGNVQAHTQFAGTTMPTKIEYKDPGGTILRTINQTIGFDASSYNDPGFNNHCTVNKPSNPRTLSETTILNDSGQSSSVQFEYGTHGNVTTKREYDFGGALLRRTVYSYLHNSSSSYASPNLHILDRKLSESIYTPSSQLKAQTLYEYDHTGITSTGGTPSPQHDCASHPSTFATRGNLTKAKRWRNTDGAWLTTTNTYNDVGNLLQTIDPGGHVTTFSYADNFTDGINRNSRAFVTQTTLPTTGGSMSRL